MPLKLYKDSVSTLLGSSSGQDPMKELLKPGHGTAGCFHTFMITEALFFGSNKTYNLIKVFNYKGSVHSKS